MNRIQVSPNFILRLTVKASTAVTVNCFYVYEDEKGREQSNLLTLIHSGDRVGTNTTVPFYDGTVKFLSISTPTNSIYRGQCYVVAEMYYTNATTAPVFTFRRGYITSSTAQCWPSGADEDSFSGKGYISLTEVNNTTVTVPTNTIQRVLNVRVDVTTDANVANRYPRLSILNTGGYLVSHAIYPTAITASSGPFYVVYSEAMQIASTGTYRTTPLPLGFYLTSNTPTMESQLVAAQVGDTYPIVRYQSEEWLV